MRVLLTTEGTYPYFAGGVSTWAHALVRGLDRHEFTVFAIVPDPHVAARYPLPRHVQLVTVPLWGTERLDEYLPRSRRQRRRSMERLFLPAFDALLEQLLAFDDANVVGASLLRLADYARADDLQRAFKDPRTWSRVLTRLQRDPVYRRLRLDDAVDFARSLYRYLSPLAWPLPAADVVHASAAAFCALPGIVEKRRAGVPFLLTEHGVYLRERVLAFVRQETNPLRRRLFTNFYDAIARTAYAHADVVAPVCAYNTRWERELGVSEEKITIVHNGIDPGLFAVRPTTASRPTIAFVGRLDPLKDLECLFEALALVRQTIPDVVLRLHGSGEGNDEYVARCRSAVLRLQIADIVHFEGPTDDVCDVLCDCDCAVLSSVSEGFPYSALEAMFAGRPIVATAVGGTSEAIGDENLLVPPRDPRALADALRRVLTMPHPERASLGAQLRTRAEAHFAESSFLERYDDLYAEVAS